MQSSSSLCSELFIKHILILDESGSLNSFNLFLLLSLSSFVLGFLLLLLLFLVLSVRYKFHFVACLFGCQLFLNICCFSFALLLKLFSLLLLFQVLFLLDLSGLFNGLSLLPIQLLFSLIDSIISFFVVDLFG